MHTFLLNLIRNYGDEERKFFIYSQKDKSSFKREEFFSLFTVTQPSSFIFVPGPPRMRVRKWSLYKYNQTVGASFQLITEPQFYGLLTTMQHVKRTQGGIENQSTPHLLAARFEYRVIENNQVCTTWGGVFVNFLRA